MEDGKLWLCPSCGYRERINDKEPRECPKCNSPMRKIIVSSIKEPKPGVERVMGFGIKSFFLIFILSSLFVLYNHSDKNLIIESNIVPNNILPSCPKCHEMKSVWDHRYATPSEVCERCHENVVLENKMKVLECLGCHNSLEKSHNPDRKDCLYCHKPGVKSSPGLLGKTLKAIPKDLLPKSFYCENCHKPHINEEARDCQNCHYVSERGLHSLITHSQCLSCHKPHQFLVTEREVCEACHVDKKTHNQPLFCGECHSFGGYLLLFLNLIFEHDADLKVMNL